jgi:hypothetical protein
VQQLRCDLPSSKRGRTISISGPHTARRDQNIGDSFAELSFSNEEMSPNSLPSMNSNNLGSDGQESVNECQLSDTSDWDIGEGYQNAHGGGTDIGKHQVGGNLDDQLSTRDEERVQIGPGSPTCVVTFANDCHDQAFLIHEQDCVNWDRLGRHVPSEISIQSRGQPGDLSITCQLASSLHATGRPAGVGKEDQKLHMLAAAASADAAKRRAAELLPRF